MIWLTWIGKQMIFFLSQIGEAMLLLWRTIGQLPKINWKLTIEQMAHLGVHSLPILSLTMFFAGAVMTLQMADVLIHYGAPGTVGGIMAIAITAELGTMKVTEQIDALKVMAVNPIGYLVVPRVVACMIMVPILTFYGVLIGTGGGYLVATMLKGLAGSTYLDSIQLFAVLSDLTYGLIKSCVFGAVIALVGSYKGMYTDMGATAVGYATTSSVVTSIILVFILNYFLSVILF